MDVLVTGADGDLGRAVAEGFRAAGHRVVVTGLAPEQLELVAGELGVEAVLCDPADPASLAASQPRFPQHLDAVITVPGRSWPGADPSNSTVPDTALSWRSVSIARSSLRGSDRAGRRRPTALRRSDRGRRPPHPTAVPKPPPRRRCRTGRPGRPPISEPAGSPSTPSPTGASRSPATTV